MLELTLMERSASKLSVASVPAVLAIEALTVISPLPPLPLAVVIVTLLPWFKTVSMSVLWLGFRGLGCHLEVTGVRGFRQGR